MKKNKKIIILIFVFGILLIAVGLYFLFSTSKNTTNPLKNADNSINNDIDESNGDDENIQIADNSINEEVIDETRENSIPEEVKEESNTTDNTTSNNNSNSNQTTNTPVTVESTFTQKVMKTSEGIDLKYWLYTPKNPSSNMPLIVYLHGGSARGDDLNKVVEGSFPEFLKNGELGNINAYVIMPQVPSSYKGWSDINVSVRDLITNTKTTYGINENKISLTGHSMGGKGTYDIALAYPNLFSCIAPMSGSITVNDINVNKLKSLPIWAFVGLSDTIVDPSTSTAFLTEIRKYNSNSKLTTFEGATHFDVPELGYKGTDVINWLISNSK